MITKQDVIRWIESIPEENFKTALIMFEGERKNACKIEGVFINICTMIAGVSLQVEDFRNAVIETAGFLKMKGGEE